MLDKTITHIYNNDHQRNQAYKKLSQKKTRNLNNMHHKPKIKKIEMTSNKREG